MISFPLKGSFFTQALDQLESLQEEGCACFSIFFSSSDEVSPHPLQDKTQHVLEQDAQTSIISQKATSILDIPAPKIIVPQISAQQTDLVEPLKVTLPEPATPTLIRNANGKVQFLESIEKAMEEQWGTKFPVLQKLPIPPIFELALNLNRIPKGYHSELCEVFNVEPSNSSLVLPTRNGLLLLLHKLGFNKLDKAERLHFLLSCLHNFQYFTHYHFVERIHIPSSQGALSTPLKAPYMRYLAILLECVRINPKLKINLWYNQAKQSYLTHQEILQHIKNLHDRTYRVLTSEQSLLSKNKEKILSIPDYYSSKELSPRYLDAREEIVDSYRLRQQSIDLESDCTRVHRSVIAQNIGKRSLMEDTFFVEDLEIMWKDKKIMAHFTALLDGHGADKNNVKHSIAHFFKMVFISQFKRYYDHFEDLSPFLRIVNTLKIAVVDTAQHFPLLSTGTTLNLCLRLKNLLFVANVGDTRTLLITPEEHLDVKPLSRDYKPQHLKQVPTSRMGYNKNGRLLTPSLLPYEYESFGPAGALGNHSTLGTLKDRPEVLIYSLSKEQLKSSTLVQVTDGVTDMMSNEEIGHFIRNFPSNLKRISGLTEMALIETALRMGSNDNVSALFTRLNKNF